MIQGSNRRLANVKTRTETGLEYVLTSLDIYTPFGQKILKELKPFFPGQEEDLRKELEKVKDMVSFTEENRDSIEKLDVIFMCMNNSSLTIERSANNALSVVELFELKTLLLQMRSISSILESGSARVPDEFVLGDTEALLDELDPRRDRMNTFYIYDDFSEKLADLRRQKKELEHSVRRALKARREEIRKEYGIMLTPKFDIVIPKSGDELAKARQIKDLEQVAEDYASVTFELSKTEAIYEITKAMEDITTSIEDEELVIRERLSRKVSEFAHILLENCEKIGRLEFALAKAKYAIKHNCVKPEIVDEHIIDICEGRELQVEDVLKSKGKAYCPVSMTLEEGVTCITGANMGGKTISLKLSGLVPLMAQYGFFVPCESARIGLSNYMQILIGDSQSVERGLSSFGSEMEELKEILDNSQERSVILIDEIASGTNPVEGLALTRSLVDYLRRKPYITLITTHFEAVTEDPGIKNMQVRGLSNVDFRKLESELQRANRRERINIISKYMDYRLYTVTENRQIPKDALNIAKMLGISSEIIEGAQKYIK